MPEIWIFRSTEIWETELSCWTAKVEEFINTNDTARLRSVLVQISLIDFQNPLIQKCKDQFE